MKWLWSDIRSAHLTLAIACVLVVIEGCVSSLDFLRRREVYDTFGLNHDGLADGRVWQLISHGLIHAGWLHVSLNVVLLITTGARVERISGKGTVGKVFAAGVLLGGLVFLIVPLANEGRTLVGSSGGVFSLLLWMTTVSPESRMFPIAVSARNLGLGLLIASGLLAVVGAFLTLGAAPVSHACHFGGGIAGVILGRRSLGRQVKLHDLQKERARREIADGPRGQ